MTECWPCANAADNHSSPFNDPTAVGGCTRCNAFTCNGHAEFDTATGLLYCAPCAGGGDSSPPTGPGPGNQPPNQPTNQPTRPSGLSLVFSSIGEAIRRFPRFHERSKAHADAFKASNNIADMLERLAPNWERTRGETIDLGAVDPDLIAAGIGLTLWSAGLSAGELPEPSPYVPDWLVKNPLLAMYLSEVVF